jgi:hypothetical protein
MMTTVVRSILVGAWISGGKVRSVWFFDVDVDLVELGARSSAGVLRRNVSSPEVDLIEFGS